MAGVTRDGERKPLVLTDGTKVWLNAGSRLSYLPGFSAATREVMLEGEAFFDVTEDKSKPFVVHAGHVLIRVLGTAFNVKAYHEDHSVTTSLYRGLVSITREQDGQTSQPILLYPHQKIILPVDAQALGDQSASPKELAPVKIEFMDSSQAEPKRIETSWIYNRLEFRGDDFITLAYKLQHWFNIKVNFGDVAVQRLSFNGSFEKETIDQAMKALQLANPFLYKIENNEVFIYSAP
ncbi:FecR family protein [Niabella hibiscisoli]|uniref:FecR family protein n=1 Tax=Niabella hibiscisoli TaxID=1825928 RepID=UPI00293EE39F|nr:FecR domain-containing protein [Niabella hibiscisoli]